ncbi:hypothetical protein [Paractinoplanes deccanensis]|uniref:hypothetical protein n=1 Tax=Paractinoplanes deccanensis TaxID=113561 RepID=UPI0031D0BFA4
MVLLVAVLVPMALIAAGMTAATAVSTSGAIAAFALGAAHQVAQLLGAPGRRAAPLPGNA